MSLPVTLELGQMTSKAAVGSLAVAMPAFPGLSLSEAKVVGALGFTYSMFSELESSAATSFIARAGHLCDGRKAAK